MAIRVRKTYDGRWETIHSFQPPAIYLDHWAIRRFTNDAALGTRFVSALKKAGGSWCISHQTLAEFSGAGDIAHAEAAEVLLDSALSNVYCVELDAKKAIRAENENGGSSGLRPPPDHEMLSLITDRLMETSGILSLKGLLVAVAQSKDNVGVAFRETNQEISHMIARQRADPDYVRKARNFRPTRDRPPTLTLMGEILRPIVLDPTMPFNENDASDLQHAVISTTYCQYILLDKKWEHMLEIARKRIEEFALPFAPAKCFSEARNGIDRFLSELESLQEVPKSA